MPVTRFTKSDMKRGSFMIVQCAFDKEKYSVIQVGVMGGGADACMMSQGVALEECYEYFFKETMKTKSEDRALYVIDESRLFTREI